MCMLWRTRCRLSQQSLSGKFWLLLPTRARTVADKMCWISVIAHQWSISGLTPLSMLNRRASGERAGRLFMRRYRRRRTSTITTTAKSFDLHPGPELIGAILKSRLWLRSRIRWTGSPLDVSFGSCESGAACFGSDYSVAAHMRREGLIAANLMDEEGGSTCRSEHT